jgi:DNA topoisomerase-3
VKYNKKEEGAYMITIMAEKFSVAAKIAAALDSIKLNGRSVTTENLDHYQTNVESEYKKKRYIPISYLGKPCAVTWAEGHLCSLKQAKDYNPDYKNWSKIPIPFIPEKYEIKPVERDGKTSQFAINQLNFLKQCFKKSEFIINATDDDREGEVIFAYIYQYCKSTTPYKRVVLNSQTKTGFRTAFNPSNLKTAAEVHNTEMAGRARGAADWIVGANLTALFTLKYNSKIPLSVGRVQTWVLNIIVQKEKEIQNFVSKPFWRIRAKFQTPRNEQYEAEYNEKQIFDKKKAEDILNGISGKPGIVTQYEKTIQKKTPPLLYNLSCLSIDANRLYGISAKETLDILQSLYMDGYTTYPRTVSRYLTDDMQQDVDSVLDMLMKIPEYTAFVLPKKQRQYHSYYFNTQKVDSHFAVIPTTEQPKNLSGNRKRIYDLVAQSVLQMVYPEAIIERTKIITSVEDKPFISTGLTIKDPQWLQVRTNSKMKYLPTVSKGESMQGEYGLVTGKTKPPQHFTDGTLLTAMRTAGKTITNKELRNVLQVSEEGGIGRESTRANIIETVVKRYCVRKKKEIIPTQRGMLFIDAMPVSDFKSAETTAAWEQDLDKVAKGIESFDSFMSDIEERTKQWCKIIEKAKPDDALLREEQKSQSNETNLCCPICNAPIIEKEKGFFCSGEKCDFVIWKKIAHHALSMSQVKQLIQLGKTSVITDFKNKSGNKFAASLALNRNSHKIEFFFDSEYKCPFCGRTLSVSEKGMYCPGIKNKSCSFFLPNIKGGKKLSDTEKKALLDGKVITSNQFYSKKTNKKFTAKLRINPNTHNIDMIFPKT